MTYGLWFALIVGTAIGVWPFWFVWILDKKDKEIKERKKKAKGKG